MTWALVQKSASQGTTASGADVTGTLPVASAGTAAAPRLVVAHLNASGAGTWTLPTGWAQGAGVSNGSSHATHLYFVDTGTHVGTSTVFTYSNASGNLKCFLEEASTTVANATITLNAQGTGVAGALATCTASTGTSAAAGDFGACDFMEHFASATAITWTDPAGWVLVGSDGASAGNHQYCAHLLSAAAGTLTVTGTSSVASGSTAGWAGVVSTFTAAPPAPAGGTPGFVGCWNSPDVWGSGTTTQQAVADFAAVVSRTMLARRVYWGVSGLPTAITSDLKADADAGRKACMSLRPAWNPPASADLDTINSFLSSCKNYGLVADVALWHEPYYASLSSGAAPGMTAAQFLAMFRFYAATIRQYYPAVFNTSAGSVWNNNENAWYPGDAYVDKCVTDFYYNAYSLGVRLGSGGSRDPASPADSASPPKPFGLWETMTSTDPTSGQTQTQATTFWGYVKTYFTGRLTAGKSNADILVFNSNQNLSQETAITTTPDYRVPLFQGWYDALNAVTGTAVLNITTASVPGATQGVAYTTTLAAVGGSGGNTWSLFSGSLPAGITLSSAGVISGTDTTVSGTFSFAVLVTDSAGHTDTQALTLTVAASATAVNIVITSLPDATVGTSYAQPLAAVNGTSPYTWALLAGTALPDGLAMDTSGNITGTPTTAATWGFTAVVTDALGGTDTQALFLTVDPATVSGGYPATYTGTYGATLAASPAAAPADSLPQVIIEAGLPSRAPAVPAGTFILDDAVYGKLGTGKLGDSTTWTGLSGLFRNGTLTRPSTRMQGPLFSFQGSTATATFDNTTGVLDPDNTAGPYYGFLRPMVPVRVRAVYGSVTYPVWEGFAGSWQDANVTYDQGYSEVTLSADDGFKILAGITIPALTSGAAGEAELSGARITRILNAAGWYTDHRRVAVGDSPMQGTTMGDTALNLLQLTADTEIGQLYIDGGGNLVFRNRHAVLTDARSAVPQAVFGDLPGRDAFLAGDASTFEGGTGGWVADTNCALAQTTAQAHGGSGGSLQITSTAAGNIKAASTGAPLTGGMPVLPADTLNVSAWFRAAVSARSCVAQVDWFSSAGTYISTSSGGTVTSSTTGWAQSVGASLAPPANAAYARAAAAVLSTGAGGEVHYVDDVLFGAQAELPYASVGRAKDDTILANDVQAQRVGGTPQEARSGASIRTYLFPRSYTRPDLLLETDQETLAWAQWVLTVSLTGEDRFESVTIDPLADPASLFPQVLGREIGDRITVIRRPQNSAQVISRDCFITGVTHAVDAVNGTWSTTWTLADTSKYSGFLILDDTASGKLGTAKLAF